MLAPMSSHSCCSLSPVTATVPRPHPFTSLQAAFQQHYFLCCHGFPLSKVHFHTNVCLCPQTTTSVLTSVTELLWVVFPTPSDP